MADRPYMTLAVDPVRNDRTKHSNVASPDSARSGVWVGRTRQVQDYFSSYEGTSRQRSGKCAVRKRFPLQKTSRGKKLKNKQAGTYTMKTYRKSNEQLFSQ